MSTKPKTAAKAAAEKQDSPQKRAGASSEPSFSAEQFIRSKVMNAAPDVIRAVLKDSLLTVAEANEAINHFLNREV